MQTPSAAPGAIALVGSGEFLPVMDETDRWLLDRVGGAAQARVVVLPTASGLEEPASPARWMRMGVDHFTRLGAQVDAVPILDHRAAHDPRLVGRLEDADFYYFSGGNPQHLIDSMIGTPAWEVILRRHAAGASLAGCSAGAMAICGGTVSRLRVVREGAPVEWVSALGLLPLLVVMPHFDRMVTYVGREALDHVLHSVPGGSTLLGIDEDTALVRLDAQPDTSGHTSWQVMGKRSVTTFSVDYSSVYQSGELVRLRSQ